MKKLTLGVFLLVISVCIISVETVEAKKKGAISVDQGDNITLNAKKRVKVTVKASNNRVITEKDQRGNIRITGVKPGKVSILIKEGHNKRKVSVNVKPYRKAPVGKQRQLSAEEVIIASEISGAADKYVSFDAYPNMVNWGSVPEHQKRTVRTQWTVMPSYLKDCLVSWGVVIEFGEIESSERSKYDLGTIGYATSDRYIKMHISEEVGRTAVTTLIHESAHIWSYYCKEKGFDVLSTIDGMYKKNPSLYGDYGSTSRGEFFAQMTAVPLAINIEQFTEKDLADMFDAGTRVTVKKAGGKHVVLKVKIEDSAIFCLGNEYFNRIYANGLYFEDFYTQRELAVIKKQRKRYEEKGMIVDRVDLSYHID